MPFLLFLFLFLYSIDHFLLWRFIFFFINGVHSSETRRRPLLSSNRQLVVLNSLCWFIDRLLWDIFLCLHQIGMLFQSWFVIHFIAVTCILHNIRLETKSCRILHREFTVKHDGT